MRKSLAAIGSSTLVRTTPVPHWVLDEAMPFLSDTELRVLLVVARSTLGWREGQGRKESDWLSHRQLQVRTGRSSAVVSRAVDGLVKRGMLVVSNAVGEPLVSAGARSRSRGRLFFRVTMPKDWKDLRFKSTGRGADGNTDDSLADEAQLSTASKTEATDGRIALLGAEPASESKGFIPEFTSETVPRNLRTTKETGTKENRNTGGRVITLKVPTIKNEVSGVAREDWKVLDSMENGTKCVSMGNTHERVNGSGIENVDIEGDKTVAAADIELTVQAKRFVTSFNQAHEMAKPGERLPMLNLAVSTLLERRLKQYSVEDLEVWLPPFFECTFGYVRRRHWSLESYLESFQLLQAAESTRKQ